MPNQKTGILMKNPVTKDMQLKMENVTAQFDLQQVIKEPKHVSNTSSSCIDLIFTSQPNLITDSGVHSSLHPNCHHQIVFAKLNLYIAYLPPCL